MDYEIIADEACHCGEGPIWHMAEQRLYWQDSTTGRLFRYDPRADRHEQVLKMDYIGATTVQPDGSMLVFGSGCGVWRWHGGELSTWIDPIPGESRFNDVGADPEGRVFAGSMPVPDPDNPGMPRQLGRLFLYQRDKSYQPVEENLGCANGVGFSLDYKTLYYVDSPTHLIYAYDYDRATGNISNRRDLARVDDSMVPDGLTVDAEGCIWCAMWDGSCVMRFDSDGHLMQTVKLPTPNVTSVMFGGANLDELYITSAGGHEKDKKGPHAGALFRIRPGVKGLPENLSMLGV